MANEFVARNGLISLSTVTTSNSGINIGSTTTSIISDGSSIFIKASGNTYLNTANSAYVSAIGVVYGTNFSGPGTGLTGTAASLSIGGKSDGAIKLWSVSHPNDFYISNTWDGTYWQLTSNHGSAVNVGRANSAGTATNVAYSGLTGTVPTWNQNTTGNADTATLINASGSLTTQFGDGKIGYSYQLQNTQTGLFSGVDNSNSILTINRHSGNYYSQLGFSSNGNIYYRSFSATAINTSQGWQTIWTSNSLTNLNQLTNGPGYTTNTGTVTSVSTAGTVSGLTLTGGTFTTSGTITLGGTLSLTSANVTTALGFTPYNSTNPSGYITSAGTAANAGNATTANYATTAGSAPNAGNANANYDLSAADGNAIRFWSSNSYSIHMSLATNGTYGGRIAGETTSDYNMYFNMANSSNRGFVFRNGLGSELFSINPNGCRSISDIIAYSSSDERLKDNIVLIENSLDKISKIGGYMFDWNDKQDTYTGHDIGIIAQEIEDILPEVVTTRKNGYKAVKYEKIVPLLIEGIKDLKLIVENQQRQIDLLLNK